MQVGARADNWSARAARAGRPPRDRCPAGPADARSRRSAARHGGPGRPAAPGRGSPGRGVRPNGSGMAVDLRRVAAKRRCRSAGQRRALVHGTDTAGHGVVQSHRSSLEHVHPADACGGEHGTRCAGRAVPRPRWQRWRFRGACRYSAARWPVRVASAASSAAKRGRGGDLRRSCVASRRATGNRPRRSRCCSAATGAPPGAVGARPSRYRTTSGPTPSTITRRVPTSNCAASAARQSTRPAGCSVVAASATRVGTGHSQYRDTPSGPVRGYPQGYGPSWGDTRKTPDSARCSCTHVWKSLCVRVDRTRPPTPAERPRGRTSLPS